MTIKEADNYMKNGQPIMYEGHQYRIKEIIIWYDKANERKCSLLLYNEHSTTYRVKLENCYIND